MFLQNAQKSNQNNIIYFNKVLSLFMTTTCSGSCLFLLIFPAINIAPGNTECLLF